MTFFVLRLIAKCGIMTWYGSTLAEGVLLVIIVAAPDSDDLPHALLGAALADSPGMVYQSAVLMAWAHAYAGNWFLHPSLSSRLWLLFHNIFTLFVIHHIGVIQVL